MSGTRASAIRANIVAALRSATLDARAGTEDRLRHLDVSRSPDSAPERTFRVVLAAQPHKGTLQTTDDYQAEFTIEVFYALGPAVEDRIASDAERFWWTLETLQSLNEGILVADPSPVGVSEIEGNMVARYSVIVRYRLDSALVA